MVTIYFRPDRDIRTKDCEKRSKMPLPCYRPKKHIPGAFNCTGRLRLKRSSLWLAGLVTPDRRQAKIEMGV